MSKRVAGYGMFIALSFLFSYIETWIPFSFGIPGAKLGLANLVTLTALYVMSSRDALWILLVRIVLTGFTFGNLSMVFYSLGGGLLSFLVMCFCKEKTGLHKTGVSVAGGIAHNLGQLLVAAAVVQNGRLLYYFPFLLLFGTLSGALIGMLGALVIRRIPGEFCQSGEPGSPSGQAWSASPSVSCDGLEEPAGVFWRKDLALAGSCLLVSAGLLAFFSLFRVGRDQKEAAVYVGEKEFGRFDLDREWTLEIPGENGGTNLLVIQEGKALVTQASCPDKLCVRQGAVSEIGESIVCLPNKVIVAVEASGN